MCGSLCSFCVSSSMPGRLELIHPAFQVISFNCDMWWLSMVVVVVGVWVLCGGVMWGWYPRTGRVHLVSSCRIRWGMCGSSSCNVGVIISSPLAMFVLIRV